MHKESIFANLTGPNAVDMTEEQAAILIQLGCVPLDHMLHEPMEGRLLPAAFPDAPFNISVITRRLAVMTPDVQYVPATILFLTSLAPNVGGVVTMAYSLYRETQARGAISLVDVARHLVPNGVPNEECFHRWWLGQKRAEPSINDNRIDTQEFWA